jgi:hypothetical protein
MLVKLLLILTGIFSLLISAVVVLAYDDAYFSDLSLFLEPPRDCPAPCFMGIQPGQTTLDEAIALLESHAWVKDVRAYIGDLTQYEGLVCWSWSGKQPAFINAETYLSPCLHTQRGTSLIAGISIPAAISFGEVWLLYKPQQMILTDFTKRKAEAYYTGVYLQNTLYITASPLTCPIDVSDIWDKPTIVEIGEMSEAYIRGRATRPYPQFELRGWRTERPC